MNWTLIAIIGLIILLVFYFQKCTLSCPCNNSHDNFGQDPSIRANAGWVAGPIYGYDPIDQFAEQIQEMKERLREKADKIGCGPACSINETECAKCFQQPPREPLVIGVMPTEEPENPIPGYPTNKIEHHPPYAPSQIKFDEPFDNSLPFTTCKACS